jgi:putative transposase
MLRKDNFVPGEIYHIYNRGVEKRIIFKEVSDYRRFMIMLYLSNSTKPFNISDLKRGKQYADMFTVDRKDNLVSILAWCLMNNHFHLLLKEKIDGGITKFMKKLCTGYSMYFNKKNNRTGSLFSNRFQSKLVGDDLYFDKIFSYIHLNPLEVLDNKTWQGLENLEDYNEEFHNIFSEKIKNLLSKYHYSSFLDYIGDRVESKIIMREDRPQVKIKYFSL